MRTWVHERKSQSLRHFKNARTIGCSLALHGFCNDHYYCPRGLDKSCSQFLNQKRVKKKKEDPRPRPIAKSTSVRPSFIPSNPTPPTQSNSGSAQTPENHLKKAHLDERLRRTHEHSQERALILTVGILSTLAPGRICPDGANLQICPDGWIRPLFSPKVVRICPIFRNLIVRGCLVRVGNLCVEVVEE